MREMRDVIRRPTLLTSAAGFLIASLMLGSGGPALGVEDLFARMGVQRPTNVRLAPDLELPTLDGKTAHLKDFRGKAVLLGFFTTT